VMKRQVAAGCWVPQIVTLLLHQMLLLLVHLDCCCSYGLQRYWGLIPQQLYHLHPQVYFHLYRPHR
jgi:hypothetical protein